MSVPDPQAAEFGPGPYLIGAVICERILVEKDGVKSLIRVFDQVTHTIEAPDPPPQMPTFDQHLGVWVSFRRGTFGGTRRLVVAGVEPRDPTTETVLFDQVVSFDGVLGSGIDAFGIVNLHVESPGLHWFVVRLDEEVVTRMPFRVTYRPIIKPAEARPE